MPQFDTPLSPLLHVLLGDNDKTREEIRED